MSASLRPRSLRRHRSEMRGSHGVLFGASNIVAVRRAAAGALYSSAPDYLTLIRMLMHGGAGYVKAG
jgi:hypothetical protein